MFKNRPFLTAYVLASLGFLIAIGVSTALYVEVKDLSQENADIIAANEADATERRDQSCALFESQHLQEVQSLRETYRYLNALSPEELTQTINQFVIAGLPKVEEDANTDEAPDYCDEPHVGLPEPDPVVPEHQDFTQYLIVK